MKRQNSVLFWAPIVRITREAKFIVHFIAFLPLPLYHDTFMSCVILRRYFVDFRPTERRRLFALFLFLDISRKTQPSILPTGVQCSSDILTVLVHNYR